MSPSLLCRKNLAPTVWPPTPLKQREEAMQQDAWGGGLPSLATFLPTWSRMHSLVHSFIHSLFIEHGAKEGTVCFYFKMGGQV